MNASAVARSRVKIEPDRPYATRVVEPERLVQVRGGHEGHDRPEHLVLGDAHPGVTPSSTVAGWNAPTDGTVGPDHDARPVRLRVRDHRPPPGHAPRRR